MSTYTTQLKTIINQPTQHINDLTLDQRIEVGRQKLFDFDYPMFDERYKPVFERHFIENFYDKEIGFETEFLFKRRLKNWLQLNMGYYSKLLESETMKFDPFINSRVDVTHTKKNDETSKTDRNYGETNSRDTIDGTVTNEGTSKDTEKGLTGSTTDDTAKGVTGNITNDTNTRVDGTSNDTTDTTLDGSTDTRMQSKSDGTTTYDTDSTTDRDTSSHSQSDMIGNTTGTSDGTSNTTENSTSTSDGTSNTTDHTTGSESTTGTRKEDEFNRKLHSDTPDSRLSITVSGTNNSISGDGEGSAGYASDITEDKGYENESTTGQSDTETDSKTDNTTHDKTSTNSKTDTTTHDSTVTDSTQNQITDGTETEDILTNEKERGTSSDTTTGTENETKNETGNQTSTGTTSETGSKNEQGRTQEDTTITEKGTQKEDVVTAEKGTKHETVDRNIGESGKKDFNEVSDGSINSLEDFIQHRVGKIGVQTYSKMLMEFRETFLRVERQCFEEIEGRLFMLVY